MNSKKVSKIFLINSKKELFLYLRDNIATIPYAGWWDLIGGSIEPGETSRQAIKREMKEEIEFEGEDIKFVGTFFVERSDLGIENTKIFVFKGIINKPLDKIKLNEGQRAAFFKLDELSKIKFPKHYQDFLSNHEIL